MAIVDIFVLFCFVLGVFGAFMTAFHPNILYAAIALVGALVSVAGMYGALGADFLAAAQLIIYVGGILIVILFAVMMSEDIYKQRFVASAKRYILPVLFSILLFAGLSYLVRGVNWQTSPLTHAPTTRDMGWALVGTYALVFQYVVVVLLAGLIGAVVIARPAIKDDAMDGEE